MSDLPHLSFKYNWNVSPILNSSSPIFKCLSIILSHFSHKLRVPLGLILPWELLVPFHSLPKPSSFVLSFQVLSQRHCQLNSSFQPSPGPLYSSPLVSFILSLSVFFRPNPLLSTSTGHSHHNPVVEQARSLFCGAGARVQTARRAQHVFYRENHWRFLHTKTEIDTWHNSRPCQVSRFLSTTQSCPTTASCILEETFGDQLVQPPEKAGLTRTGCFQALVQSSSEHVQRRWLHNFSGPHSHVWPPSR